jgi:hypothetical protein
MLKLRIDSGHVMVALGALTNDNGMKCTVYKAGRNLIIQNIDFDRADKILTRMCIPYIPSKVVYTSEPQALTF